MYRQVIIFGPDPNGGFKLEQERTLLIAQSSEVLVIGDGKRDISLAEIQARLIGRINAATRIDICMHGSVEDLTGSHKVQLSNSSTIDTSAEFTRSLFEMLNNASLGQPIYTHLWSCQAAAADKDYAYLADESVVVLHSSEHALSKSSILASFNYNEYDGTAVGARRDVMSNLESIIEAGGTLKFRRSGKEYAIKYVLPEVVEAGRGYFDFIYKYFHQNGIEAIVSASDDVERDIQELINVFEKVLGQDELQYREVTNRARLKEARDQYRVQRLYKAYSRNPRKFEETCRKAKLNVNSRSLSGWRIVDVEDKKMIESLIRLGWNVNSSHDENGYTPLHYTISKNYIVAQVLLKAGADPNIEDRQGFTVIHYAEDKKTVDLLKKYGANINHLAGGFTPLQRAILKKNYIVAQALLEAGADPNIEDRLGFTAIYYDQDKKTVDLLKKYGANINHLAGDSTPLQRAISNKNYIMAQALLEAGADPNIENTSADTAIHYAEDKKTVDLLKKYGANINHLTRDGLTPLHCAILMKDYTVAQALLEAGVDPNIEDSLGYTAIHRAEDKKTVEFLLNHGANPFIQGNPLIHDFLRALEDPTDYVIKMNLKPLEFIKAIKFMQTIEDMTVPLDPGRIKAFLDQNTVVSKTCSISNFRKIIKGGDLEAIQIALSFNPVVTLKDVEMANRIFGPRLPLEIREQMIAMSSGEGPQIPARKKLLRDPIEPSVQRQEREI